MLKNKLNITDEVELSKIEEKITKLKALELYDSGKINTIEVGTFKGLAQIHNYLFSDIYDFAGKMRTVNIAKGNFRFASVLSRSLPTPIKTGRFPFAQNSQNSVAY